MTSSKARQAPSGAVCQLCGERRLVARAIGACGACLRAGSPEGQELALAAHARSRAAIGLPGLRPEDPRTRACEVCANRCQPSEGELGVCGTRVAVNRVVKPLVGTAQAAAVSWRQDPLPTNCCARFVCPAANECGYPRYSWTPGAEHGYRNLAVGYYGCTFDCLYCQSWQARTTDGAERKSATELAEAVDERTSCICFFGGDPTPQMAHALASAKLARKRAVKEGRILRICFETNGAMNRALLEKAADLALESGGCIKFDLKAFHPAVHQALCGAANEATLANFAWLAARRHERPEVPLAIAATTLVPGYVDVEEVEPLSRYLAGLGTDIPYLLIGFFSCYQMSDLPNTSRQQARRCLKAAKAAGLTCVQLDNAALLRDAPEESRRTRARSG